MSFPDITQNIGTITETIETTTEAPQVTNPDFDTLAPSSINGQRNAQTEQNTVISQTNTISGQINTLSGQINTAGSYIDNSLQEIEQATNFQGNYDAGTTYSKNQTVLSGGIYYFSLVDSNTGNTPASSPTFWQIKPSNKLFGGNGVDGEVLGYDSSSTEKFRLDANGYTFFNGGNVGINETNPDYPLTVKGVGAHLNRVGSDFGAILKLSRNSVQKWLVQGGKDTALDNLAIANASGTAVLAINQTGHVGINKTAASTTLDVNGPVRVGQYTTGTLPSAASSGVGSLAYDTTTDTLKVVNNSLAWVNV